MDNLRLTEKGNTLTVTISGEVTLDNTLEIKKRFDEVLERDRYASIILDLSGVTFIDSSGIGALVVFNTKVKTQGKLLFLFMPSDPVRKTLSLVQLVSFFDILDSEDDLLTVLPD
ncbi:MAG: STAS domain-containing protein [Desulfovibrionaceae bacterium]|jgi:anti-sigma B factor antagonist|nr:STAS domain-containing protein [Desulfovibrionaceae bacterium]